jgi:hypothetical protein
VTAAASIVLGSTAALAQDAEPGVASPPPVAEPTPPPPPSTGASPRLEERGDGEKRDSVHFRFGLGLDGNFMFAPNPTGLLGLGPGLQLRLGAQINSWFATYYQAHAIVAGTIKGTGLATNATLIGAVFNSVLAEATLPVLHIGVGPSVDVLGVEGLSFANGQTGSVTPVFGIDGRVAIVIGGHGPGHHAGFDIEGNVHPSFWNGIVLTTLTAGIGGEIY